MPHIIHYIYTKCEIPIHIYDEIYRYDSKTMYTRKNAQVVTDLQTSCNRLLSSRYQDVFALLVPSCCDKSGTSCYHLVTKLMTVTDLLQVVPTRLYRLFVCPSLLSSHC
jgi:hypothetical protein